MKARWYKVLAALGCLLLIPSAPAGADDETCTVSLESEQYVVGEEPVEVWGTAAGCEGQRLITVVERYGGLRQNGEVIIGPDETFRLHVTDFPTGFGDHLIKAGVPGVSVSEPRWVKRAAPPTLHTAETKRVGRATNAWGRCDAVGPVEVQVRFRVGDRYSLSRTTTSDAHGGYVIPLTYASDTAGAWPFRVECVYPGGWRQLAEATLYRYDRMELQLPRAPHYVEDTTNVSGTMPNLAMPMIRRASTQALTPGGWSTSQTSNALWEFTIPLTYGVTQPGPTTYRVVLEMTDGEVVHSNPFTLDRVYNTAWRRASINTAIVSYQYCYRGSCPGAPVGRASNVWGTFTGVQQPLEVWTEVNPGNGIWRTSQKGMTDATGGYVLPNTYAWDQQDQFNLRVAARHPDGKVTYSESIVFRRL